MSAHIPRQRFGQNFLQNKHILEKIYAAIAPQKKDHMVEIGPGLGALTQGLLPHVDKLDVVEIDRDLVAVLQKEFSEYKNLTIHSADALKFDFGQLANANKKLRVVGNLPYNISTPLLFHLLDFHLHIEDMYFMLQREVVERICAPPGNKVYGRLSVMLQYHCDVELLFTVPPSAFHPAPKVESAIIHLKPKTDLPLTPREYERFSELVRLAFTQRRKTLANIFKSYVDKSAWAEIQLNPLERPEQLTVKQFIHITRWSFQHATH